jgi:hypothetical protein
LRRINAEINRHSPDDPGLESDNSIFPALVEAQDASDGLLLGRQLARNRRFAVLVRRSIENTFA